MALFIVERVGTGFSVRSGENTLQAAASALTAEAWAEGTLPGGAGTKSAKEWSEESALSAATAEAAAGPTYASTAAGLAATTSGQAFAVDAGGGLVSVYLNSSGTAVFQRAVATTGALASWGINAQGLDNTGATNISAALQALIGVYPVIRLPAGTFYAAIDITSPTVIVGAGRDETILTTEALTNGTTITVNADLELRNLTVKGHPSNASSRTIAHSGAYTVRARNVLFTGTNHDPATGLSAIGDYRDCQFHTTVMPAGLGARCWSPFGVFTNCDFTGARCIEARDSKFYFCRIGDDTTGTGVHVPDGAKLNGGAASGYSGRYELHDCIVSVGGEGITQGNEGRGILRRTTIRAGLVGTGKFALYARSNSVFDAEDCHFFSANNGTAVSFAKTVGQAAGIGPSGESVFKRCRLEGAFNALSVPTLSDAYPASIGNAILIDCEVVGGDSKIAPNASTYHIFRTEKALNFVDALSFTADSQTLRIRYKDANQFVTVAGSDAAKTGCRISHLDRVTGLPLPDGMEIAVRYGGVSSRFVTLASGATADGGSMFFAGNASTLFCDQQRIFHFRLQGTNWRQIDGSSVALAQITSQAGSSAIASAADAINTTDKFTGKLVWDSINNRMMRAMGTSPTSPWRTMDGLTVVTPA